MGLALCVPEVLDHRGLGRVDYVIGGVKKGGDEYRGGVVVSGWGFSVGEEVEYRGVDDAVW